MPNRFDTFQTFVSSREVPQYHSIIQTSTSHIPQRRGVSTNPSSLGYMIEDSAK